MPREMCIEGKHMAPVIKALSSEVRLQILDMLTHEDLNIQTIAQKLGISKTAALMHINLLEKAGFINTVYRNGPTGNQRICHKVYDRLVFDFDDMHGADDEQNYYEAEIPVGNYFAFDVWAPCGLAKVNRLIHHWDDPAVFCEVDRINATLFWTAFGYVEYLIPLRTLFDDKRVSRVKFSFESSAAHMVANHKSLVLPDNISRDRLTPDLTDLTMWVNGIEVGSCLVESGNDRESAALTPAWWQTKPCHGKKISLSIAEDGCYINKQRVSDVTSNEVLSCRKDFITLRIGIKPDAQHINGFFLFGKDFGSYNMDLKAKFYISD